MAVGHLLTVDRHHLRLAWLVDFLFSGLLRCFLYSLILFLGLSLVLGLHLSLVDLGILRLGFLLVCFLFHRIGLSLVLGLVCCLFLAQLLHVSNCHTIASPDEPWQVNVERMMRKLGHKLTLSFGFGLLCRDAQRVRKFLRILIQ